MVVDLQKAGIWKRVAAWMLDAILVAVLAVGFGALLAWGLGYDTHAQTLEDTYARYEAQYGVSFGISVGDYEALTPEQRQQYEAASAALLEDREAATAYNTVINQSLMIVTFGLLLGILAVELAVPLLLGNGQTLGKKVFALGLIREDSVKVTALQLVVRALLGKFTVETMIPVYIVMMVLFGNMGLLGTALLMIMGLAQVILLCVTKNHSLIHDLAAATVVVDIASQKVFASTEELIAYTKRVHAEEARRQTY